MKKKYENKEARTDEAAPEQTDLPAAAAPRRKLICIRECVMPSVGAFAHGQNVEDLALIEKIGDNPNFQSIEEGQ
jgi:hypothetical protein